ncbi:MAG: hypothetical protein Kow0058_14150 [Roseovarius sp.]
MSISDISTRASRVRFAGIVSRLIARLVAWNETRLTRRALSRLSDRELDDIGLTRDDIDRIHV